MRKHENAVANDTESATAWWTRWDSNPRSPRCERGALPTKLRARVNLIHFSVSAPICQDLFKTFFTPPVMSPPLSFNMPPNPPIPPPSYILQPPLIASVSHTLFILFNFATDVAAVRFRTPEVKSRISTLQPPLIVSVPHTLFTLFNLIVEGATDRFRTPEVKILISILYFLSSNLYPPSSIF